MSSGSTLGSVSRFKSKDGNFPFNLILSNAAIEYSFNRFIIGSTISNKSWKLCFFPRCVVN